jgi:hypothetical protein
MRPPERFEAIAILLCATGLIFCAAAPVQAQATRGGGATGGIGGAGGQGSQGGQGGQTGNSAGGILVDAAGVVRPLFHQEAFGRLDKKRRQELAGRLLPADLNHASSMRKISLVQLEAACERCFAEKKPLPDELKFLAGLQRIDYVFAYPADKDLVIAGPAEGFVVNAGGRALGVASGQPALRLDDLLVALRTIDRGRGAIRCSIDPNQANLAKFVSFVAGNPGDTTVESATARYQQMAGILGLQDVSLSGIPPDSQFAELLVEADVRMKYVAIGLDKPPVKGFRSHLAMVGAGGNSMQRWWFTPLYDAFTKTADGLGFEFSGQRVQLLSEDELVSADGKRSSAAFQRVTTQKFSKQFTDRFPELARAVPVFAELQGLFDLSVLAALIKKEGLAAKVGWTMSLFLDDERAAIAKRNVPRKIPSVSNFKMLGRGVMVMQVTGGVIINPADVIRHNEFQRDSGGKLNAMQKEAAPAEGAQKNGPENDRWWWD